VKALAFTDPEFVVFTTRDYAYAADVALATASRQLGRAADDGSLARVTRGIWANTKHPFFHPLVCVPKLLANEQGYVSFLTALQHHGVIEQLPRTIQIATTGHARKLDSPVGRFEFFHVTPRLMRDGVEWSDSRIPFPIACAEKALLDAFYVSLRRGRRFRALPELDLAPLTKRRFVGLLDRIDDPRVRSSVRARFDEAWARRRSGE